MGWVNPKTSLSIFKGTLLQGMKSTIMSYRPSPVGLGIADPIKNGLESLKSKVSGEPFPSAVSTLLVLEKPRVRGSRKPHVTPHGPEGTSTSQITGIRLSSYREPLYGGLLRKSDHCKQREKNVNTIFKFAKFIWLYFICCHCLC